MLQTRRQFLSTLGTSGLIFGLPGLVSHLNAQGSSTIRPRNAGAPTLQPAVRWSAKWIWQEQDGPANSWVAFRKTFDLSAVPETAVANIAADSKYWLWINGQMAVFEGGVSRGPSQHGPWNRAQNIRPSNTWYEEVDIKPYLKSGNNTIAILAWYWGRQTWKGTHTDSGKGGLLFQANLGRTTVLSDSSWKLKAHPAYDPDSGGGTTRLVPYNVHYDARTTLGDWTSSAWHSEGYSDSSWSDAVEKGTPPTAPWHNLEYNYVPLLVNHGLQNYTDFPDSAFPFTSTGKNIACTLPFNMQITPYLEVESDAGKTIEIDTENSRNAISARYTTKAGQQAFESYSWMSGHQVIYTIPKGVKVLSLKYRWMSVGTIAGRFACSDPFFERLYEMGSNTLMVCARDNFMDCPDRERALWIGDVADQASYLFYVMDHAGRQLLQKAIRVTLAHSKNKVFGCLAPGRVRELPSQSLQFIFQLVWQYYYNTGDADTLGFAYPYVYDYLSLWPMQANGLPRYRKGASPDSWDWNDWGKADTIDAEPIQYALYYMSLKSARDMARVLGTTEHMDWYNDRIERIEGAFNTVFWKGRYYSSDSAKFQDDRANALAILAGFADNDQAGKVVSNVLIPNHYCSPHFEWMVNEAMCVAGHYAESLDRMRTRYRGQVERKGMTTLSEKFDKGGSYNHAWNAPNTILSKYIVGVFPTKPAWSNYAVLPNTAHFTSLKQVVPSVKGNIAVDIRRENGTFVMNLTSPAETVATIGIPKDNISAIKANGKTVWKKGTRVKAQGITPTGDDENYILFEAGPGTWQFEAD